MFDLFLGRGHAPLGGRGELQARGLRPPVYAAARGGRIDVRVSSGDRELRIGTRLLPIVGASEPRVIGYHAVSEVLRDRGNAIPSAALGSGGAQQDLIATERLYRAVRLLSLVACGSQGMLFVPNTVRRLGGDPASEAEDLAELTRACGLSTRQVVVDLPEATIGETAVTRIWFEALIRHYHRAGLKVSLNKLFTGQGALERVSQLWPDIVGLDREVISRAETDPPWRRHLGRVVGLVRELYGVQTVAREVASAVHADIARACGVDWLEGPYVDRSQSVLQRTNPAGAGVTPRIAWAV